jgi:hypothetical protein
MPTATSSAPMNLSIVNPSTSGVSSDKVFVSIIGIDPATDKPAYLDFTTGQLAAFSSYVSGTTSRTLNTLGASIPVPAIQSARIYFAINEDFSSMASSGPTASANNPILFDKIEFDTHVPSACNINGTCVDFYGISYTITATPSGSTTPRTVGFTDSRGHVIGALRDLPLSPDGQKSGNTNIFAACVMQSNGKVLRVLSPKTMALSDWGSVQRATQASHFLDQYIQKHCWVPNRTFKFYDKSWPTQKNTRYGRVSADGLTLNLFTDAAMTQPYTVPSLPRPCATWPNPDFNTPTNYQNTNATDVNGIDWGFLLLGNAMGTGAGANWASDPAAMAIMVAIDRGVMHLDNGTTDWVDARKYYPGDAKGHSTEDMPIFYYSKVLHRLGLHHQAYVLSYDDVYGDNPSIFFNSGASVTVTLNSLESVPAGVPA